jgi:tripartite-type tricarboxylate transporter receptor subunit TctC
MTKLRLLLAMALAAGFACIRPAWAQDWPSRPVTLVVAFPAGGSDDILGRIVAARLSEILRQPVNVENIGGAGGMTGTSRVAKAAPDGYRIALGTSATHAVSQVARKTPLYDSLADFTPVALIAEQPFALIARKDLPADGLREFIASPRRTKRRCNMVRPARDRPPTSCARCSTPRSASRPGTCPMTAAHLRFAIWSMAASTTSVQW